LSNWFCSTSRGAQDRDAVGDAGAVRGGRLLAKTGHLDELLLGIGQPPEALWYANPNCWRIAASTLGS
jgi:hypothetical protein